MTSKQYLIIALLVPLFAFTAHKYYISLTKIDFISAEKSVQVTMRFFIDDIEKTLEQRYETDLNLATLQENKNADILLERYIQSKFNISIDGTVEPLHYLGKEYKNDIVFFYIELTNIGSINSITVKNSMLHEEFPEQENFINLNINGIKKSTVLRRLNDKEMLNF